MREGEVTVALSEQDQTAVRRARRIVQGYFCVAFALWWATVIGQVCVDNQ